jgi:hypothetical protein
MRWWKVGIYASVAWMLLVVVLGAGWLWYISSHPMGENLDEARSEKAGEVVGMLLVAGLVAIWAYAVIRLKNRSPA